MAWVSAHGRLNIHVTHNFGLSCVGAYPGYNFHTFVWKLLHLPLEIRCMGAYLGVGACLEYYSMSKEGPWAMHCTCTHVHVLYIQRQGANIYGP